MADTASGIYHPRDPTDSPLWNLLNNHYDDFEKHYEEKYEKKYGYFRPVISEVVTEYLKCGDLKEGFARIRCQDCGHEFILSFSPAKEDGFARPAMPKRLSSLPTW